MTNIKYEGGVATNLHAKIAAHIANHTSLVFVQRTNVYVTGQNKNALRPSGISLLTSYRLGRNTFSTVSTFSFIVDASFQATLSLRFTVFRAEAGQKKIPH